MGARQFQAEGAEVGGTGGFCGGGSLISFFVLQSASKPQRATSAYEDVSLTDTANVCDSMLPGHNFMPRQHRDITTTA